MVLILQTKRIQADRHILMKSYKLWKYFSQKSVVNYWFIIWETADLSSYPSLLQMDNPKIILVQACIITMKRSVRSDARHCLADQYLTRASQILISHRLASTAAHIAAIKYLLSLFNNRLYNYNWISKIALSHEFKCRNNRMAVQVYFRNHMVEVF